jgi:superfamily II DNA or RNA helicase
MEKSRIEKLELLQDQASQSWISSGGKGSLELATGVGKTFSSIKCVYKALDSSWIKLGDKVLFLAETQVREQTILDDIKKFNTIYGKNLSKDFHVEFACYQSAYKWTGLHYNVVIADECHMSLSAEYSKFYFNNTYDYIVGLSATIDRSTVVTEEPFVNKGMLLDKIAPVCFSYNAKQARLDGILPPIEVYVIKHRLDGIHKTILSGTKDKPFYQTELDAYNYRDKQFKQALFMQGPKKDFAIQNSSRARAKILYELPSKIDECKLLLDNLKLRTLVFANSLDALHKITPYVIASKDAKGKTLTKQNNQDMIDDFGLGKIDTLGSFKMLEQGVNLPELDALIIHSYYSKTLGIVQRTGRLRFREDFTGIVIIFVTEGTQEVTWYYKMMEGVDMEAITYCKDAQHCIDLIKARRK